MITWDKVAEHGRIAGTVFDRGAIVFLIKQKGSDEFTLTGAIIPDREENNNYSSLDVAKDVAEAFWNSFINEVLTATFIDRYVVNGCCSLCGNIGKIDTRGSSTPAGHPCGALNYCICPNGQFLRDSS